ncbi:FliA/WhiG family RNA polymerase sigma factor [Alteribacter lacisalsi]|uniref:FliA/WhiG family RNA polymerase sigma factor n=1 Tax=Alteribacter lacisalsi TaxID=2045244 RepID=A0A2W0HB50_9BACI|nr:FliA/WhiG family RNA polymerase sigma factor [Alteribacter lacisalsi]PYZ98036.1 FliA/WhiG family RNA polymerase sigma factor [Alteribacter lacisalsi]
MIKGKVSSQLDQCWESWHNRRDKDSCDLLIKAYMPLVDYHVQRVRNGMPRNVNSGELKSHGMMGLYDALLKFDKTRDLKFDTYASFRIKGAIIDGLRQEDRLPRSLREKAKRIEAVQEQLEQELCRMPEPSEVAAAAEMTEAEVVRTMNESLISHFLSIDDSAGDEGSSPSFVQTIADLREPTPEDHAVKTAKYEELASCISRLTENEQLVLSLFYFEELTLTEIGRVLSLSTSRISQIHSRALYKLEQLLRAMPV